MDKLDPSQLKEWNPYALIALWSAITITIGAAATWMTNQGYDLWVKIQDRRLKLRLELANLPQPTPKFDINQLFEDKEISRGYKLWMLDMSKRTAELETRYTDLHAHYVECLQDKAQAVAEVTSNQKTIQRLDREISRLQRELNISPESPPGSEEQN